MRAVALLLCCACAAAQNPPSVEMVAVPPGDFLMGLERGEGRDLPSTPQHKVHLDGYEIGKFEFTNAQAAAVLNWAVAQGRLPLPADDAPTVELYGTPLLDLATRGAGLRLQQGLFTVAQRDGRDLANYPLLLVSWHGAVALCNWLSEWQGLSPCYDLAQWQLVNAGGGGYRLPTEAEWERAAGWNAESGAMQPYALPAAELNGSICNYFGRPGGYSPIATFGNFPFPSPVGAYQGQASPVGCFDMSGNVWEWCGDWYAADYYATSPAANPSGPAAGTARVERGGSWRSDAAYCRTTFRNWDKPDVMLYDLGFRVARSIASPAAPHTASSPGPPPPAR